MQEVRRPGSDGTLTECAAVSASRCAIWGVLNVTPDSFSDGGRYLSEDAAVARGRELLDEGADVLDVGGESTRPAGKTYGDGFSAVSADEEIQRVVPVVRRLVSELGATVSIDTTKPAVAAAAIDAGASIVNDVGAGRDKKLAEVAAEGSAAYVVMHNRGDGEVRAPHTDYEHVVDDVLEELVTAAARVQASGVEENDIWIDPGIGFAKTARQSAALLASLPRFVATGFNVLVGASRKSFIAALAPRPNGDPPTTDDRLGGSAAAVTVAALAGCQAVRVHDVAVMRQAVQVALGLESPS